MLYHVMQNTVAQIAPGPPRQGEQQVEQHLIPIMDPTLPKIHLDYYKRPYMILCKEKYSCALTDRVPKKLTSKGLLR